MTIDRAAFIREGRAEGAAAYADELFSSVAQFSALPPESQSAMTLIAIGEDALTVARTAWVLEPESKMVEDGLRLCMQATTAAYACWYAEEAELELPLGRGRVRVKSGHEARRGGPIPWIRAASIAAILRDRETTRRLVTLDPVPDESIGVQFAMWGHREQVALRCFLEDEDESVVLRRIEEMREFTKPGRIEPWSERAAIDFGLPEMALLEAIVRKDEGAIRTALTAALERFQNHYEASQPMPLESVLAIELIGLSAIAVDRGLYIDVEADEFPERLVDGIDNDP